MSRGDYPAFPARVFEPIGDNTDHGGMTLREHFAGLAMQGLLASGEWHDKGTVMRSRVFADALLAELEGGEGERDE